MKRRQFLLWSAALSMGWPASAELRVVDRHTGLETGFPDEVRQPRTLAEVQDLVRTGPHPICVAGRLHSSGGQPVCDGARLLDMTGMRRVLAVDPVQGWVDVEPGVQWWQVIEAVRQQAPRWTLRQKQSIASVTVGGSISANAHGNGLGMPPLGSDVLELDLVDHEGLLHCLRPGEPWFRAAVGGYGLMGVLTRVRLSLVPRQGLRVHASFVRLEEVAESLQLRRWEGALYGSCELDCGPQARLRDGLLLYEMPGQGPPLASRNLSPGAADWVRSMDLLHRDRAAFYAQMARSWLALSGQSWWADDLLMSETYVDAYHRQLGVGCDPIAELFVPPSRLVDIVVLLESRLASAGLPILQASVRHVAADVCSALTYAPDDCLGVAVMVHLDPQDGERYKGVMRQCLEDIIAMQGRFHPAFGRFATATQMAECFPWEAFLALKARFDPPGRFRSNWYNTLVQGREESAPGKP